MEDPYQVEKDDISRGIDSIAADANYWRGCAQARWEMVLDGLGKVGELEREIEQLKASQVVVNQNVVSDVGTVVARLHVTGEETMEKVLFLGDTWGVNYALQGDVNGVHFSENKTVTFELVAPRHLTLEPCGICRGVKLLREGELASHAELHNVSTGFGGRWDVVLWDGQEMRVVNGTPGWGPWGNDAAERAAINQLDSDFHAVGQVHVTRKTVTEVKYFD